MKPSHQRVLAFVEAYYDAHGIGPSLRDMCAACDLASTSVASYACQVLEARGQLVSVGFGTARGYVPAWAPGLRQRVTALEAQLAAAQKREM